MFGFAMSRCILVCPYFPADAGDGAPAQVRGAGKNARIVEIAQGILQSEETPLDSPFVKPGLCLLIGWCTVGRPEVSKSLIERGYMEWSVKTLSSMPATHWAACAGQPHALACSIIWCLKDATTEARALGVDIEERALKSGAVDMCLDLLAAHETLGARPDTNAGLLTYAMWMMSSLNYRDNAMLREKVRSRLDVMRWHCAHPVAHFMVRTCTTGSWGAIVVANVSGKEESAYLQQDHIDGAVAHIARLTHPTPGKVVILSRFVALSASLTRKVSLFEHYRQLRPRLAPRRAAGTAGPQHDGLRRE